MSPRARCQNHHDINELFCKTSLVKTSLWLSARGAKRLIRKPCSKCRRLLYSTRRVDSEAVASIIEAKEEEWEYVPPKLDVEISSVAIGLDGTCMSLCKTGWREAMVGTISLYDPQGDRQHTIYMGPPPSMAKPGF